MGIVHVSLSLEYNSWILSSENRSWNSPNVSCSLNTCPPSTAYMLGKSRHHWCLIGTSHYLNQYWVIFNWTLRNKLQGNFNHNTKLFIHNNAHENVVCEMRSILPKDIWVKGFLLLLSVELTFKVSGLNYLVSAESRRRFSSWKTLKADRSRPNSSLHISIYFDNCDHHVHIDCTGMTNIYV